MKRILFSLIALFCVSSYMLADDAWTVGNITIPQGKTAVAEVYLTNGTTKYRDFQFDLVLPQGLTFVKAQKGEVFAETQHSIATNTVAENTERIICSSNAGDTFSGTATPFVLVTIQADASVAVGTQLTVKLTGVEITTDTEKINPADVTFKATIESAVKVLDETATQLPEATDKVYEVKVNRTINANEWSTLCLPFAMTANQLKDAFGTDVKLADFTGYDSETDNANNIVDIHVNFESMDVAQGLEANYPCLIRTSLDITDFTLETSIQPSQDDAIVEYDNGKPDSRRKVYGTFYGTLKAGDMVPQNGLFLNGNKFYYSTGNTAIKAFRGYFDFVDVLTSVEDANNVKVDFNIDGNTTLINGLSTSQDGSAVYTIDGKHMGSDMERLHRGIYIQNGKKVVK